MTATSDDIALADRIGRRRARLMPVLAIIFVLQQGAFLLSPPGDAVRTADHVKIGTWVVLSAVLVAFLRTGGMWRSGRTVRALLNDDESRANRADAMSLGFLVAMVAALILYVVAGFTVVGAREAIHLIVSTGIIAAMLRFGVLERRGFD